MPKTNFRIARISKPEAAKVLKPYHYLTGVSKDFKSGYNYGCFKGEELVGVAIFTALSVPELACGMFGLARSEQAGLFELSRLCLTPEVQRTEHNLASWFLSRAIKHLREQTAVRAILSYADDSTHRGVVYAASNFKYYGLTAAKKDFYTRGEDGTLTKQSRGKVKGLLGEWRDRTRKHRFVIVFDKALTIRWPEQKWANGRLPATY